MSYLDLKFFSVTVCGTSCVHDLIHELDGLETIAETMPPI